MDTKFPRMVAIQQRALAILRIFLGLGFLYAFSLKLGPDYVAGFAKTAQSLAKGNPVGFYADFLRSSVLDAGQTFAYLLMLGELLVGAMLVLGLFTAPIGILAAVIALNYALALAASGPLAVGLGILAAVVGFVLALGYAGTTWGLDRHLIDRMPHWFVGLLHYEYLEF